MRTNKRIGFGVAIAAAFLMPGLASAHDDKCLNVEVDAKRHNGDLVDAIANTDFPLRKGSKRWGRTVNADQANLLSKSDAAWSYGLDGKQVSSLR